MTPEVASFERKHNAVPTPEGGVGGIVLTMYMAAANKAAFFPFQSSHSYPALGGNVQISGKMAQREGSV